MVGSIFLKLICSLFNFEHNFYLLLLFKNILTLPHFQKLYLLSSYINFALQANYDNISM
jgi:hypothetical protein